MSQSPPPRVPRPWLSLTSAFLITTASAQSSSLVTNRPFEERSRLQGSSLFSEIAPESSGLVAENHYRDPRMWADLYQEFTVGAIGTGVALGDFDGDGWLDVFVTSKTERNRLFKNMGQLRFEDVTDRAGIITPAGTWNQGAAFLDINNDRRLDLYVCRFGAPNLLFVNQGDGTFREEASARGVAVVSASGMVAVGDYDRDGWVDIYVQTNLWDAAKRPHGEPDFLFRNRGDGTFEDVSARAGISGHTQGHSAIWWDYNNDQWPDLYVANDFARPDFLYQNNRDGTFTEVAASALPHTPYSAMGSDTADLNGDGFTDLLVADMAGSTHERDQRGPADARTRNRDHRAGTREPAQFQRNALFLATGGPYALEAAHLAGLAATDWTWSARLEDLDNDGLVDAHFTTGMVRELDNVDLLARMKAAESAAQRFAIMRDSPVHAQENFVFKNRGDLRFENVGARWGLAQTGVSFAAAFGDLDNDGDLDLITSNFQQGPRLFRNDEADQNRVLVELIGRRSNSYGIGASVAVETDDGRQTKTLNPTRGYMASNEPAVHFGLGTARQLKSIVVTWPSGKVQSVERLAANHRITLTEPETAPATNSTSVSAPPPRFAEVGASINLNAVHTAASVEETQRLLPVRHNRNGPLMTAGDLNGDGVKDVLITGTPKSPAQLLLSQAGGAFGRRPLPGEASHTIVNDGPAALLDFDNDGDLDILLTRGGASLPAGAADYNPVLLKNNGAAVLEAVPAGTIPAAPFSIGAIVAADFNRDGLTDVFLGQRLTPGRFPTSGASLLWINRGGRFEAAPAEWVSSLHSLGMVTGAVGEDVNLDGWTDLVISTDWGPICYLENRAGRGFIDRSDQLGMKRAGHGLWNAISSAELNGDGRPDFILCNRGLNTIHQASREEPMILLYGSFRDASGSQVVEGIHERGVLRPLLTRRQLGGALPSVLKRFPRNDDYARAALGEVLGEERVAKASRWEVTELRSGFLLSRADATYDFVPAPRIAQISPWQSAACADFDRDGDIDVAVVQNSSAAIPYYGRAHGGLGQLLMNDGTGKFFPESPLKSGFVVPGESRSVVVLDFDVNGAPDLLVGRHDATALAFQNQ
jgi:enediyne biosynthesis protein E4